MEPRANRFGDTWLQNQAAFVLEKKLVSEMYGQEGELRRDDDWLELHAEAVLQPPSGGSLRPCEQCRVRSTLQSHQWTFAFDALLKF